MKLKNLGNSGSPIVTSGCELKTLIVFYDQSDLLILVVFRIIDAVNLKVLGRICYTGKVLLAIQIEFFSQWHNTCIRNKGLY